MLSDSLMDKQANLLSLIIAKNHSRLKAATAEKEAAEFSIRALEIRMTYEETLSEQHLAVFRIEMAERAKTEGEKVNQSVESLRERVASLELKLSETKEGEKVAEKSLEGVAEASTKAAQQDKFTDFVAQAQKRLLG
ncbi:hypothetical protein FRC09_005049 [Ceratobasidium sp. 395]|nr:hypothetical protein FRC09_005049 [Ceratobasidium sp. 395]